MRKTFCSYGYKSHYYQVSILKVILKVRKLGKIERCHRQTGLAGKFVSCYPC